MKNLFRIFSTKVSQHAGGAYTFVLALTIVIVWGATGPVFHFSNTWQLFINTGTTIVTFLMVFLIQNTQNRDSKALQLKLDELIRASGSARDTFMDIEDLTDEDLAALDEQFKKLHQDNAGVAHPALHKLHTKISLAKELRQQVKHLTK